jgi:hypothetical protein
MTEKRQKILKLDDYELTLKELKNQRVQLTLNLYIIETAIARLERLVTRLRPKINQQNDNLEHNPTD